MALIINLPCGINNIRVQIAWLSKFVFRSSNISLHISTLLTYMLYPTVARFLTPWVCFYTWVICSIHGSKLKFKEEPRNIPSYHVQQNLQRLSKGLFWKSILLTLVPSKYSCSASRFFQSTVWFLSSTWYEHLISVLQVGMDLDRRTCLPFYVGFTLCMHRKCILLWLPSVPFRI